LRILFSAFSAYSPFGSESLVGRHYAEVLGRRHTLSVITCAPTDVTTAMPGVRSVHAIDLGGGQFNEVARSGLLAFELRQWRPASRARRAGIDLIHRVNPCSINDPTFLAFVNKPLVIGPVLSSTPAPESFREVLWREIRRFKIEATLMEKLRPSDRLARLVFGPMMRSWTHFKKARTIIVGSSVTMDDIPEHLHGRCTPIVYAGVEHGVFTPPAEGAPRHSKGLTRLLFVGRLIPNKAIELLLRACGRLRARHDFELTVVGRSRPWYGAFLGSVIEEERLGDRVRIIEGMPRADLVTLYREHDIFCFPSIGDTYGIALLEAMSSEMAVLVSDLGGPGEIAGEAAVRVPVVTPDQWVADAASALGGLIENPARRAELGRAARARILERHDWGKIGARLEEIYAGLP